MTLTFRKLQEEHASWAFRNFGNREPYMPLLGAMEELGELAHAHLKHVQGIRGFSDDAKFIEAAADAIADTVIYLVDYAGVNGIDFQNAVELAWSQVQRRDWKSDPEGGVNATPSPQSLTHRETFG